MAINDQYHVAVLLKESVDGLEIQPDGVYVDVTFGGGGHSREILSRLGQKGRLYAFDQDSDSMSNIPADDRFTFVRSNFRYLRNWMRYYQIDKINGLIADLGVSSHHLDDESRGFSFRFEAPLDMRMNNKAKTTAADIVNSYDECQLADILHLYGELHNARKVASAIVRTRNAAPILTTTQLMEAVAGIMPRERVKKETAKLFQALRIEVNHEMDSLRDMLETAAELMADGGRLVVITYHSLEDRIVKNMMKTGNVEGKATQDFYGNVTSPLTMLGKIITPTEEEQANNPRSRSAKLRIAEKR